MRLLAPLLLLVAGLAQGAEYSAMPTSTLGFSASYQGETFEGRFRRFTPQIRFDPANLGTSRFDVRIQLGSADSDNSERDDLLETSEFFDISRQPEARFVATRFRALAGKRYAADGLLSLHGVTKPVTLVFSWSGGSLPVLVGEATLKRLDFGVGSGDWADTGLIPNLVKVRTRLMLKAKP